MPGYDRWRVPNQPVQGFMNQNQGYQDALQQAQQDWNLLQYAHVYSPVPIAEEKKTQIVEEDSETVINNFRVGCDPEFVLLDNKGALVYANLHFLQQGPIGWDHNGRVAEFRPDPSKGVYSLVRRIQDLVGSETIKKADRKLRGGAYFNGQALGGHVHFGFNAFETKPPAGYGLRGGGKLNARGTSVVKALDALTKCLEHLNILPAKESATRRIHSVAQATYYGEYGDVRDCNGHVEYRTMASWLHDPKVAYLCLTAAKLAAADPEGAYASLKDCTSFKDLMAWIEKYKGKDLNASRAVEKLLGGGHKGLTVDPSVDFRGRWRTLGL